MVKRRTLAVAALAGATLVTPAAPAMAGGFGGTQTLRTAAAGTEIVADDIAARGLSVVVAWQENAPGGEKRVYIKRSANGGASFSSSRRLDDGQSREVQVDTCDDWVHATYAQRSGADWVVALDRYPLSGGVDNQSIITLSGVSRKPDVACAGERLAVAYFRQVAGVWRVRLYARGVNDVFGKGDSLPEIDLDLGTGDMNKGLALGGTGDHLFLAWFRGDEFKLRRWDIGPGPDFDLLGAPVALLPDQPDGFGPKIGVSGERLVLAYTDEADLRARVSTNAGATFGPERTLENMAFPSEEAAFAESADVIGDSIIVAATLVGGFEELNGEGVVQRTTNDGADWDRVPDTTKGGGGTVAAYRGTAGSPLIVQAWDRWIADPATHRLRFQRES